MLNALRRGGTTKEWIVAVHDAYVGKYEREIGADELPVHCYFPTAAECITLLEWYIDRAAEWGAEGVRLTEFAFLPCEVTTTGVKGSGNLANALTQMRLLLAYLDAQPQVLGYAWYPLYAKGTEAWAFKPLQCDTSLLTADGQLTAFGDAYAPLR